MDARPRLVLHMGTHKTGTTSQQENLARDRVWLAERRVLYPDPSPYGFSGGSTAHHGLAKHLAEADVLSSSALRFRDDLLTRATEHDVIVLSTEQFWRRTIGFDARSCNPHDPAWQDARRRFLERLAGYLEAFDVVPLLWFRNTSDYAQSMFKETQFLGGELAASVEEYVQMRAERFAYDVQLGLIEAALGPADVRLFTDAVREGVYPAMLSALGRSDRPVTAPAYLRHSPSNRASLWLSRLKKGKGLSKSRRKAAHAFALSERGRQALAGPKTALWRSQEAYVAFAQQFQSSRLPSTNADPNEDINIVPWQDADHARAERAFAAWRVRRLVGLS